MNNRNHRPGEVTCTQAFFGMWAALSMTILCIGRVSAADSLDAAAALLGSVSKAPVRQFSTRDFGREKYASARSVLVTERDAEHVLKAVRQQLPKGMIAFVGTVRSLAEPPVNGVEMVVAPGATQFDILRVAASDAVNYGMETEDLIRELQKWDAEFGIDIWQAQTDMIQIRLKRLPADVSAFAERVYKFCPDIVDQGVGSVNELARAIRKTREVGLWWD